jgi:DNA polymerase III epsilon subunit family exonuclease
LTEKEGKRSGRPTRGFVAGWRRRAATGEPRSPRRDAASLLPPDWRELRYLAFDVETTGLDPKSCRVIELAAFVFDLGHPREPLGSMDRLVNPGVPIPEAARAVHGISDGDVAAAPLFSEIAAEFEALAEGTILVAHNASFDLGFISMEFAKTGRPAPVNRVLDSLRLARAAFPGLPSYSLPRLAASLGIVPARSHRALDDALACAEVFAAAVARLTDGAI